MDPNRWLTPAIAAPSDTGTSSGPALALDSTRWRVDDPDKLPRTSEAHLGGRPLDARQRAVEAYCGEVCPPESATAAAQAALSSGASTDAELLKAARVYAAERATTVTSPRGWREVLAAEHEHPCDETPSRLAARANETLLERDERELEQHLGSCLECQAAEVCELRATRAFHAVIGDGAEGTETIASPPADNGATDATAAAFWAPTAATGIDAATGSALAADGAPRIGDAERSSPIEAPRHRRFASRRALLAIAVFALLAAAATALLLRKGVQNRPAAATVQAATPTSTAASPPVAHHPKAAHRARRQGAVRTHNAGRHVKRAATHKTVAAALVVASATPPATVVTPLRAAPAPVETPAPASNPAPPTSTGPRSVSTVSQSSLPAVSAPQGLGSSTVGK